MFSNTLISDIRHFPDQDNMSEIIAFNSENNQKLQLVKSDVLMQHQTTLLCVETESSLSPVCVVIRASLAFVDILKSALPCAL